MAKMKVYELAKELDVQSKDVVAYLTENGSAVKSHASNIEDKEIEMVRGKFGKKAAPAEKPAVKTAEPVKVDWNKPYEDMSVEELQEAILEKMRKNGPVTEYMLGTVRENTHRGSLLSWVRSFN